MRSCFGWMALIALAAACGSDDEACEPPPDDGKYHPEPNGARVSEETACETLRGAIETRQMALVDCVATLSICPGFLVAEYGAGKEYDGGTVDACATYFASATCDQIKAPENCALTYYPEPPDACAE